MPIVTVPDPVLNKKCQKIEEFDDETKKLGKDLVETLLNAKNPEGAGLAAPQIGILKRVIVVRKFMSNPLDPYKELSQEFILFNPEVISHSPDKETDWEGCLSIPDTYGKVERPKKVKVKAQNQNGEEITLNASGFFSRVIQHEIDHLDGILFTDKTVGKVLNEEQLDKLYEDYSRIAA